MFVFHEKIVTRFWEHSRVINNIFEPRWPQHPKWYKIAFKIFYASVNPATVYLFKSNN